MRRTLAALLFVSALAAIGLAPQAGAVPPAVTITGAASPTHLDGPGTVSFTYTITVTGAAATGVVITTHQGPEVPVDAATVRFDGAAVPAQTLTETAPDITLRAGAGADGTNGGTVSVGTHTLTFSSQVTSTTATQVSSSASISAAGADTTSLPVVVALNEPDLALALPPGSGEDRPAPLGTGATIYFAAELRNFGAAASGELTIQLPPGLELGADGVVRYVNLDAYDNGDSTPLTCSGTSGTITCAAGPVATTGVTADPPIIEVALRATAAGVAGTSATFTVSIAPTSGGDFDPSNDSVHATIDFTGIAHLSFAISPDRTDVVVGHSTRITLSVTNHGPQPASQAIGLALLDGDEHFGITGFDGATVDPAQLAVLNGSARSAARHDVRAASGDRMVRAAASGRRPAAAPMQDLGVVWNLGTVPAGGTVTAHLTVEAKALGSAQLALFAVSAAADPACDQAAPLCAPAIVTLRAVAAPLVTPASPSSAAPVLANTGTPAAGLLVAGLACLVAGAGATAAGRRRTSGTG